MVVPPYALFTRYSGRWTAYKEVLTPPVTRFHRLGSTNSWSATDITRYRDTFFTVLR